MLYFETLKTKIVKINQLIDMHLLYKNAQAADVHGRFASTRAALAVELLLSNISIIALARVGLNALD